MRACYYDIRNRIVQPPLWYDSNGVPRYDPFSPEDVPDIYANEAAMVRIKCQSCGQHFDVGLQMSALEHGPRLADLIRVRYLSYGDPPHHGCGGDSMSSEEISVVEYWVRAGFDWIRNSEWEVVLS